MYGKKRLDLAEYNRKYKSEQVKGNKNGRYIDGRCKNREVYPMEFNNELKEKIRERDNRMCQICGLKEEDNKVKLSTHHIDYNKKRNTESNLISLCSKCH